MDPDSILDLHFLCFVEKDGEIYELDGRKRSAVNHGKCDDLLRASVKVIKQFISRDSSQLNFSVIALATKQS
jgi:ubiquitin carboxyl-terminal hydrolase L3